MSKNKIAIIGCGNIANFHVPALRAAGMDCIHCASSPNSKTINDFALKHKIDQIWKDPYELAKAADKWDGLVISSSTEQIPDILKIALTSGKPILVEKPVAISSYQLRKFSNYAPKNIIVAYNRRHYNTVKKTRIFVQNRKNLRANMSLPENVSSKAVDPYLLVRTNSIHGIDILNYIFKKINLVHVYEACDNSPYFGRQVILKSYEGHLINLAMNWNAPANFTLSLDDGKQRLDLLSFEKFQLYQGMQVIEPTQDYPVRQYTPKVIESGTVFDEMPSDIKPGFLGQAIEFRDLINGKNPSISANLKDAYKAQLMIERIIGIQEPKNILI